MAILCLSENLKHLKEKLSNIFIGYTYDKKPVFAIDIKASGAMTVLLKDAIMPNIYFIDIFFIQFFLKPLNIILFYKSNF
jgi:formyltetrahydrofolate synthetase